MIQGIYCKFDWLSFVFSDSSLREVASSFELEGAFPSFVENSFSKNIGSIDYLAYDWNGIKFFVSASDLAGIPLEVKQSDHFFDLKFPKVKIDFSGSALDYVRTNFHDRKGKQPFDWFVYQLYQRDHESHIKLTRCDIAHDFINYKPNLFKDLNDFVRSQDEAGVTRLHCKGLPSGCSYSYRGGDQGTVYLGTTACDKLLRVYDKKRQYYDPALKAWTKPLTELPYGIVDSWIRIEFQTRRKAARSIFLEDFDDIRQLYISVLRIVYDRYAFRDATIPTWKQPDCLPFWQALIPDWENIGKLIQNADFVEPKNLLEKSEKFVRSIAFRSIFVLIAKYGVEGFLKIVEEELVGCQSGYELDNNISFIKQLRASKLRSTLASIGSSIEDFPGLVSSDGVLKFNYDFNERKERLNA